MPMDVQWTDIDIMGDRKDWTYDKNNFPNLPAIVKDLHDHDQYYINIIDPAISNTKGYDVYENGVENNVFIKLFNSSELLLGWVWPGQTGK
jgi:lysosomal alpha-glucosidase